MTRKQIDDKRKRVFLKKCAPQKPITIEDLFLGNAVTVYSRRLVLTAYADDETARYMATKREETFVMVKPRDLQRVGRVVAAMQMEGMSVIELSTVTFAATRYEELAALLPEHARDLLSGTSCAIRAMGQNISATLDRVLSSADVVRSTDETNARALGEFVTAGAQTQTASANSALCLVKPSGIANLGVIIDYLVEKKGFELVSARTFSALTRAHAESFLSVYIDALPKIEVALMVEELSSGMSVALQLTRRENLPTLVDDLREIAGPRDPEIARVLRPQSLRARFGIDKQRNAVHVTDLPGDGPLEVDFFFNLGDFKAPN